MSEWASSTPGRSGRPRRQATKLEAAENDLKQLMADVTRAIEKAQDAVARIASKAAAATTETESTSR
jgi:t-SNARE complex subunit (syntaxin)